MFRGLLAYNHTLAELNLKRRAAGVLIGLGHVMVDAVELEDTRDRIILQLTRDKEPNKQ